ncbi:MAG: tRNA (adenosine(37)-N6)-threonylcarbamoyltransferase complex transferase subunit TsaD [Lachnospiraceae bacterium]|nr:tRNA (adenosine(37)-N6)-threonylcarbamoyltransferase complex transferase subunit TsaD [Lachnospiraceae bacterium]
MKPIHDKVLLAIETSCDETAAAVIGKNEYTVYSSAVASQIPLHAQWGGVVPAVASQQHVLAMNQVVRSALEEAELSPEDLEAVAVTVGPGLPGSLAVGISAAKALALGWSKPIVPVNHLMGHLFSAQLNGAVIEFPAVYLLVSGGHCMLFYAKEPGKYKLLGTTKDDSVGEAYDKVARELGFPYPGGPKLDRLAPSGKAVYPLPRPMLNSGYDFSFSGLKSSVRRVLDQEKEIDTADLTCSFVTACMEVLTTKLKRACDEYSPENAVVVGGVSASPILRELLSNDALGDTRVVFPSLKYATDNAAMIGAAGWWEYIHNGPSADTFAMMPRLALSTID